MADFLVLPPRTALGEQMAKLIRPYLPGVCVNANDCVRFLETLALANRHETIVVHSDELPAGATVTEALRDGFGADETDRIVHVALDGTARSEETRLPIGLGIPTIVPSYTPSTH
jgi:hypothetical protein